MALYWLSILSLKELVRDNSLVPKWYADGGNAVGKLKSLRTVLDNIIKRGKHFGYLVKASKNQLIVKDEKYNEALKIFKNTENEMKKKDNLLDSVIGSETENKTFLETQLEPNKILKKHCKIVKT